MVLGLLFLRGRLGCCQEEEGNNKRGEPSIGPEIHLFLL
jgi:hypothetical protein